MDFVPVPDAGAAPPSVGEPLSSVAIEIVSPRPPREATRPAPATLHVVRPSVVAGQAVRSPVVRPQLVSMSRGQPRVVPVVTMPAGAMAAVSPSMLVVMQKPVSPQPTAAEVEAFKAEQMASPVQFVVRRREAGGEENHQPSRLQELLSQPSLSSGRQPPPPEKLQSQPLPLEELQSQPPPLDEPKPQPSPRAEPQRQPSPPAEPQPQPPPPSDVQPQPAPPPAEAEHRDSPAPENSSALEPIITLRCGASYAAAMDSALEGDDTPAGQNTEANTSAVVENVDTDAAAVIANDDEDDDMPLAARARKWSSRSRGRKRPRSSSAPAAPPPPPPRPRPFLCEACHERFADRLALAAHERRHGDAAHSCQECGQSFSQLLALRRHKLHHGQAPKPRSGRRRAKAPSRYLDAAWGELGLRRSRGGAWPAETVTCGVCDEELAPEEVTEHLSPPPDTGYFRCDQCGGAFGQRCQLTRHGCRRQSERRGGRKAKKQRVSRVSAAAAAAAVAEAEAGSDAESAGGGDAAHDSGSDWETGEGADSVAAPGDTAAVDDAATAAAAAEGAGTGRLTCDVCQINFVSQRNLKRHRTQHESGTRFSCEVCEQSYARIDDLTRHSRSAHNQKRQFRCPRCMRVFTQKRIVQYHLRTHETASQKSGAAAGDPANIADGMKTESNADEEITDPPGPGPVRYTCEECGAGFDTRRRYTRHQQLRHDAQTPRYECEVCDSSYARIDELTRHSILIHRQKKTVPCPRCTRLFTQQRIVNYHVKGHDTKRVYMKIPRPYQCEECQRGFSTELLLSEHSCRNSTSAQRCVCDICGRGISCPQALRRHRLQHNEDRPAKCETCGLGFIDELALSKHVLTHSEERPYLCDHCGKGFRFKDYLVRHTRFHTGEKPYACSACDKHFATSDTLNRHFLIHTGEKPFVCEVCSRPFRQAQQLKTHMKVHREKDLPSFLGPHEGRPVVQVLGLRVSEITGGDVRFAENVEGDLRMVGDDEDDVRLVDNVGGEVRLAGDAAGEM